MSSPSAFHWPDAWWVVRTTALVVLTIAVIQSLAGITSVLILVFVGGFVAVGIEPLVSRCVERGVRRGLVLLGLAAAMLAAIVAVTLLVAIPVSRQATRLLDSLPEVMDSVAATAGTQKAQDFFASAEVQERIRDLVTALLGAVDGIVGSLFGALGGVLGFLVSAVTVAAVAVYFSLAMPRMRANARRFLRDDEKSRLLDEVISKVGSYVAGQAMVCVCAGVFAFIALWAIGVPHAGILAILVLALDAIPQVGAFLGALVAIAVALTEDVPTALAVAGFFAVYQLIENNLVAPRVFASVIQLTPMVSFLAVLLGAAFAGVLGAMVSLPLSAAGIAIARHVHNQRSGPVEDLPTPVPAT